MNMENSFSNLINILILFAVNETPYKLKSLFLLLLEICIYNHLHMYRQIITYALQTSVTATNERENGEHTSYN